jgi:hypothetical protein
VDKKRQRRRSKGSIIPKHDPPYEEKNAVCQSIKPTVPHARSLGSAMETLDVNLEVKEFLPCENLDDAVTARTDNKSAISTPNNATNAFATHDAMTGKLLHADALFEVPEADAGIMTGRDCFAAVFAEGKGGNC